MHFKIVHVWGVPVLDSCQHWGNGNNLIAMDQLEWNVGQDQKVQYFWRKRTVCVCARAQICREQNVAVCSISFLGCWCGV